MADLASFGVEDSTRIAKATKFTEKLISAGVDFVGNEDMQRLDVTYARLTIKDPSGEQGFWSCFCQSNLLKARSDACLRLNLEE